MFFVCSISVENQIRFVGVLENSSYLVANYMFNKDQKNHAEAIDDLLHSVRLLGEVAKDKLMRPADHEADRLV